MNRGVLQSSPVQQMMAAGNPNWCWSIKNNMRPPISTTHHQQTSPFLPPPTLFPHYIPPSVPSWNDNQDQLPESWSQLLLGGLVGDEDKANMSLFQAAASSASSVMDVKQENPANGCYVYGHHANDQDFQAAAAKPTSTWSPMIPNIASSPNKSCVTTSTTFSSNNMLDFSTTTTKADGIRHPPPDRSSECNSTATGGAAKKARVQPSSSTQSTFKVRKEKLGDRITALHQLVSPFGKTDTASVLLEAIGYIRFLQSQIEALSLPYLGSGGSTDRRQQQQPVVQGERNCIFPEDPGQLLNDNCIKRKGVSDQDSVEEPKDLRSRGLCLVPVSCTLQVGSDNGADYWAPALGGGFR